MKTSPTTEQPAAWIPSPAIIDHANVTATAGLLGLADYRALHRWSIQNRPAYWQLVIDRLGICFRKPPEKILDPADPLHPRWLVGARMNIVDSCLAGEDDSPAIIESNGQAHRRWTTDQLRRLTARVANGLMAQGIRPGDAVAIIMPMTATAVASYLGVIAAGAVAVSIADSFAPTEIGMRLRLSKAKLVITQDVVRWGTKVLPLYAKVVEAEGSPPIVVLMEPHRDPANTTEARIPSCPTVKISRVTSSQNNRCICEPPIWSSHHF